MTKDKNEIKAQKSGRKNKTGTKILRKGKKRAKTRTRIR